MAGSVLTGPYLGGEVAQFTIVSMLGEGPSGAVYVATGTEQEETVAVKILHVDVSAAGIGARWLATNRFLGSLTHPNIVETLAAGLVDGRSFVCWKLADSTLDEVLSRGGAMEPRRAVGLLAQAARAVDAARWAGGIGHGNLKPSNVLISTDGRLPGAERVRLCDFGLSRPDDAVKRSNAVRSSYLAPEQIRAEDPNPRSDIYALGCLLYKCLTGTHPFARDSRERLLAAHLADRPLRASRRSSRVPKQLDEVIAIAMANLPEDRFSTGEQFIAAATDALSGTAIRPPLSASLAAEPSEHQEAAGENRPSLPSSEHRIRRVRPRVRWRSLALLALTVGVVGVIAGIDLISGDDEVGAPPPRPPPKPTAQQAPAPAPQPATPETVAVPEPDVVSPGPTRTPNTAPTFELEGDSLLRVDPATDLAEEVIDVGVGPSGVVRADRAIWIANFGSGNLSKVNPTTREEELTLELNGSPTDVAYARGQAWAINGGLAPKVSRLANDRVVETMELPRPSPLSEIVLPSLTFGDGALWATAPSSTPTGISLFRIDPQTKEVTEVVGGLLPQSEVAFGAGSVWVGNLGEGIIGRIDPETLEVVAEIDVGEHVHGLAAGAGAVWVSACTVRRGFLARIDPARNQVRRIVGFRRCSFALEVGAGSIWLGSDETNRLLRVSPFSGGIVGLIEIGGTPTDIDIAKGWVWVTAQSDRYPPPEVFSSFVERQAATARRLLLSNRIERPFRGQTTRSRLADRAGPAAPPPWGVQ